MENLEEVIFYKLESAIKTYRQLAQRNITTSGLDITVDQWLILKVVLEKGELKQNEIAEKVFKDTASVTRIIELLINKEYLLREVHGNDRRRTQLKLTGKGKNILSKVHVIIQKNRRLALNGISEGKIKEMSKLLSTIISNCKTK
jgi:MarR family transcriptional regulator for hemolysin